MKWTYLPVSKSNVSRHRSPFPDQLAHLQSRRQHLKGELDRLSFYVIRILFLWVMIHLGEAFTLPLMRLSNHNVPAQQINVPQTKTHQPFGESRLTLAIFIHADKQMSINGGYVTLGQMRKEVMQHLNNQPLAKIKLVVDKGTQMNEVNEVIRELREVGIEEVHFATKRIKIKEQLLRGD